MSKLFSYSVYEIILANRGFGDYWVKRFLDTSVVSVEKEKKKKNGDQTRISSMLEKID